jgi:uncharacterized protein YciI
MVMMKTYILILLILTLLISCRKVENFNQTDDASDSTEVVKELKDSILRISEKVPSKQSSANLKAELTEKGYQIFDYIDEKTQDTILMQQYFIAFLKSGPNRSQNEAELQQLQKEHLAHLAKMYDMGFADISGPFGDDGDIRGITIYNVPTLKLADSLANSDPMVKAGRLVIEVHPWWAAKGFPLR